ncbi:unnamed protein product [Polarella glacialis]|uniref:Amino acid transporter transmembrane domain-containing protein n=1 Tax=Polarella glacialis TaxID=89957 RepID=A0A813LR85_POLGL|nr:unnamed protein product [Polarella glacialis]
MAGASALEEHTASSGSEGDEEDSGGASEHCDSSDDEDFRGVSVPQTSFNIAKNIVGEGMLSLPAGLAAGTGLATGAFLTVGFCCLMFYSFSALGRVCHFTGEKSFVGCGRHVQGQVFGSIMAVTNVIKTIFTCTAYAMIIGKSGAELAQFTLGMEVSRHIVYFIFLGAILLPLCLLRDMSKLSITSLIGLFCEAGIVVFMAVRYADGSYQPGGFYFDKIKAKDRPDFGSLGRPAIWTTGPATLVLIGSLSTAFLAHYNAPKFYHQLRRRSTRRFNIAVSAGFAAALVIFLCAMAFGYLTFGKNCEGLILSNYAVEDPLAGASRAAILLAVVFGFPIAFTGLRDNSTQLLGLDGGRRRIHFGMTCALLVVISALCSALDDLGLVNSLGGAILGSLITLVWPGLLVYLTYRQLPKSFSQLEGGIVSLLVAVLGVCLLIFGSGIIIQRRLSKAVA